MPDDLRTRIAAVLLAHDDNPDSGPDCTCGWEWQGFGLWKDAYADHIADAVIRELISAMGLRHEHRGWPNPERRWISDWKADDE